MLISVTVWPDQNMLFQILSLFLCHQTGHHSSVGWKCFRLSVCRIPDEPFSCASCWSYPLPLAFRALATLPSILRKEPCGVQAFVSVTVFLFLLRLPWDQELDLTYLCFFLEPKSVLEMIFNQGRLVRYILNTYSVCQRNLG